MTTRLRRPTRRLLAAAALLALAACGSSAKKAASDSGSSSTTAASSSTTAAASSTTAAGSTTTAPPTTTTAAGSTTSAAPAQGKPIKIAENPWAGSQVDARIAKVVLESKLNTATTVVAIDENATWPGLDAGDLDAVLEVWPSGHAPDRKTYIDEKKTVEDVGLLGPTGKIGWYVPKFVLDEHPEVATWEGFKDPKIAKLFATAQTGSKGQFLMGDSSYVSYDEEIIKNLNLPLKFVVAGSETAEITAIEQAVADKKPLLLQFWTPHWLHSVVPLTEVKLPALTDACKASAGTKDGKYACDYPPDPLYKAASVKLKDKNAAAYNFLKKFTLTTEQQNLVGSWILKDKMDPDAAAKKWVDANPDVVKGWVG
jgi:glycine betaine/proline transport system substrate-binding protein